ncbi:MAG: hypothetical protein AAGH92_07515 [Planctomycetota bacterium]
MILDAVIGLVLLATMLVALSTAFTQHRRVAETLADQRAAVRSLERVAAELQDGDARLVSGDPSTPTNFSVVGVFDAEGVVVSARSHGDGWFELMKDTRRGTESLFVRLSEAAAAGGRP